MDLILAPSSCRNSFSAKIHFCRFLVAFFIFLWCTVVPYLSINIVATGFRLCGRLSYISISNAFSEWSKLNITGILVFITESLNVNLSQDHRHEEFLIFGVRCFHANPLQYIQYIRKRKNWKFGKSVTAGRFDSRLIGVRDLGFGDSGSRKEKKKRGQSSISSAELKKFKSLKSSHQNI